MIKTSALTVLIALLAGTLAHAQVSPPGSNPLGSTAKEKNLPGRLNWPRTFGGQPDFEFSRAEVIGDYLKEHKGATVPTLGDLLEDMPLDPLGLSPKPSDTLVLGGGAGALSIDTGASETVGRLPSLNLSEQIDLSEFRDALRQRLTEYVKNWQPNLRGYDIDYLLRGLKLDGVMTSPDRRAIINGNTYRVGDQLKATVVVAPTDAELMYVMEEMMPAETSITPAQVKMYRDAYEDEIKILAAKRTQEPQLYQRTFQLPITVRAIQSRKVTLEFNGVTYDLSVPFAM